MYATCYCSTQLVLDLSGQMSSGHHTLHLSLPHCQVAYHGAPQNAYAVFVEALRSKLITKMMLIPELEDKNPAGEGIEVSSAISHPAVDVHVPSIYKSRQALLRDFAEMQVYIHAAC